MNRLEIANIAAQLTVDAANISGHARALVEAVAAPPPPQMTLYSQRDPRWRNEVYAGGMTFAAAGCYTVAVAMITSLAGYEDEPPEVARKLRAARCFSGALLGRPDRIPDAYPLVRYDGSLRWHDSPADLVRLVAELALGPVIIEADFIVATPKFNQHFCIAEAVTPDGNDLVICDPWSGSRTKLLEQYAQSHWSLQRAVYGLRLLRPLIA